MHFGPFFSTHSICGMRGRGCDGDAQDHLILDDETCDRLANGTWLRADEAEQQRHEVP